MKTAYPTMARMPGCIAVGASTGGPAAVAAFLRALGPVSVPILLVQHLPAAFVPGYARQLGHASGLRCEVARHGERPAPGEVRVAPGGFHLCVRNDGGGAVLALCDAPPEHHCRPAVDPLLRSAAEVYGRRLIAVVLTGMGCDGLDGARRVRERGGTVLAQDEESSVVWGMPGAVARAGLADVVASPEELGRWIARRIPAEVHG